MRKILLAVIVVLLLGDVPALSADGEGKVSGVLKEIRSDGKLVIDEQGPWTGPGTGIVTRSLDLTPDTRIQVVRPTGQWDPNSASPGYEIQSTDFRALKPGDFVTVTTGGRSLAVAIDVMRPDEAGLGSPRTESGR